MRIKTKLSLGTGFLFFVILLFGILSLASIYRLKKDAGLVLQNNYESLVYCNNMHDALDRLDKDTVYQSMFEVNLGKQESNITEIGEKEATERLRTNFDRIVNVANIDSIRQLIRTNIHDIVALNQGAILRKSTLAAESAESANTLLMIIFSVLILVTFTMAINFPGIISGPITSLNEGIRSIVNKNYGKRIHLLQKDEFGELANAFNTMAEKLNEYEHSNLAKITFEKSRIETIINQMHDGIIGLDENRHILFLNEVAQKLLGVKEEDILDKYALDVAIHNDLMRKLLQATPGDGELKIFNNNRENYFQIEHINVANKSQPIGEVIVLRNITPFHELNQAKTNFIANVSHELKTPIAAIKISTQLLNDQRVGTLNLEQGQLVKSISEDADRLLKITSELLNMGQVETGKIKLDIHRVLCQEIINEGLNAVQHMLQQKNLTVYQEIEADLLPVLADKEKTSWVLINYLTNAIKHSAADAQLILKVCRAGNRIQFRVKDFGAGITAEYLPKIFDRYFKIPNGVSSSGTGLGLALSKEFIESQSGRVWVDSKPGLGSMFGFELPV